MNTANKIPFFTETDNGFKFIGFYVDGADAGNAADGMPVLSASDLYRLITKATDAVNSIDLNHPTLKL
jgi:hypothetical protein